LRFLEIMFGLLEVKEAGQLNYYFALKVLLNRMENYEPLDKSNDLVRKESEFWNLSGLKAQ